MDGVFQQTVSPALRVGGLVPLTTQDFPGRLAAVVFLQGCPLRCPYCHNPHLIPRGRAPGPAWPEVRTFLEHRRGLLDAVVFSGGEPTLQPALLTAVKECRGLGYEVGLHTAGPYPARLAALLPHLDWVGMDIKAPFADYTRITGVPGSGERARASAKLILDSWVDYEFRTTVHPMLLDEEDISAIRHELAVMGAERYVLQEFRAEGCADEQLREPQGKQC